MKSTKVVILGREFSLKSEADEEYINQVAEYVNKKIEGVQQRQSMDVISTVILTALNIADDYFQLRNDRESLVDSIEHRSVQLSDFIDSRLGESLYCVGSNESNPWKWMEWIYWDSMNDWF